MAQNPAPFRPAPAVSLVSDEARERNRDVAWLLSCIPFLKNLSDPSRTLELLIHATRLRGRGAQADRVYERLRVNCGVHTTLAVVERGLEFGSDTTALPIQHMFESVVQTSIWNYLVCLDEALLGVRGLAVLQRSRGTGQAMDAVRRETWHHLSTALLDPKTSPADLTQLLTQLRDNHAAQHVASMKQYLRDQIKGFLCLQRLALAGPGEVEALLQELDRELALFLAAPHRDFVDHLNTRGTSLLELTSIYSEAGNGLVQGTSRVPPASLAVRAGIVARWLDAYRPALLDACASSIGPLRRFLDLPFTAVVWSGVKLCPERAMGLDRVVPWTAPDHLALEEHRSYVLAALEDRCHASTGLRCCRFFDVLLQQAAQGLLPVCTARAGIFLPLVSRVAAEAATAYQRHLDRHLRPLASEADHPWPEDLQALVKSGKRTRAPVVQKAPEIPEIPTAPPVSQEVPLYGCVPVRLKRDHAILHALSKCLEQHPNDQLQNRVSLDAVCKMARVLVPTLQRLSDQQLKQATSHCCKEMVKRLNASIGAEDAPSDFFVSYSAERDRRGDGKVLGILCSSDGLKRLQQATTAVVQRMAFDGDAFEKEWKPTRGGQAHAAAVARSLESANHKSRCLGK